MDGVMKKFFSNGVDKETAYSVYHDSSINKLNIPNKNILRDENYNIKPIVSNYTKTNPNIVPEIYKDPEIGLKASNKSPFMTNKPAIDHTYPSFNNLIQTIPKQKKALKPADKDDNRISMKMQVMEEKLKNIENKKMRLDTIKKTANAAAFESLVDEVKEEVSERLIFETFENKEAFSNLMTEIKQWKSEVMNKFNSMQNQQTMQLENLKYVLEHSGSKRVSALSKRLLGNSDLDFNYKFTKPSNEELSDAQKEILINRDNRRKTTNQVDIKDIVRDMDNEDFYNVENNTDTVKPPLKSAMKKNTVNNLSIDSTNKLIPSKTLQFSRREWEDTRKRSIKQDNFFYDK